MPYEANQSISLREAQAKLQPMSDGDFLRGIAALVLHAAAYNIPCDDAALKASYRAAVGDIPGDLFIAAVKATLIDWVDGFRLPAPGIIRAKVAEDMRLRRVRLTRLSERHYEPPPPVDLGPRIDPEEISRIVQEAKRNLAMGAKR